MAANVWKITIEDGAPVEAGAVIAILESMKMEIPVEAETAGTVRLAVAEGDNIAEDDLIATVE
jgi:acetyl-CoA carboxylase biotin carboxyl carrier protein